MRPENRELPSLGVEQTVEIVHTAQNRGGHNLKHTKIYLPGSGLNCGIVIKSLYGILRGAP